MWTTENEDDGEDISAVDDDDDGGLVKKELVDGLIAAVSTADLDRISGLTVLAAENCR